MNSNIFGGAPQRRKLVDHGSLLIKRTLCLYHCLQMHQNLDGGHIFTVLILAMNRY